MTYEPKSRSIIRGPLAIMTILVLLTTVAFSGNAAVAAQPRAAATSAFTNFKLGETPGTVCPGSGSQCNNIAGEPAIRADKSGNFYASSENGLGGGTVAWKSTDGGLHYTTLASPNQVSGNNDTGFAPGGGDTDLATAPVKNANGKYNVYVASLSLANVDVSTSTDGGTTWKLNPVGALVPGDDREWIAADGSSKVCVSYHDVATFNIDVNCSFDAGTTFTQLGDAIDVNHAWLIDDNEIGNLAINPSNHYIYQIFSGVANASEDVTSTTGETDYHAVWMAVSKDGGKTFTDHPVYINPDKTVGYGHQFTNVSVDRAGNVYALYSDDHNLYYSYSTNYGKNWSKPVRVNKKPSNTAIMPWSVAGDNGKLDVVWYGTSYYDGTNTPDNYPLSASWHVYFAQNLHATTPGSTFSQTAASPINHYGGVCESGIGCTGNRDLYDDFGIAANPKTGLASIVYTSDQPTNDPSSVHTSVATQTSGTGIYTP